MVVEPWGPWPWGRTKIKVNRSTCSRIQNRRGGDGVRQQVGESSGRKQTGHRGEQGCSQNSDRMYICSDTCKTLREEETHLAEIMA